ncbi:hypothetical protein STFE110948_02440 [Streptobacillus felis]|uniref:hypothetical protein n=1 Tax=Streptobacillus felis TaxID=1384509 RepID=UPI00082D06ED|nr:hypothetical protein [Streptobacillus felis]
MLENFDERTLPRYLKNDIDAWVNKNESNRHIWDCLWGELYGSINSAQHDFVISKEVADYLRNKYLGI